jgi:Mrp family chromosome partitioning ATPase
VDNPSTVAGERKRITPMKTQIISVMSFGDPVERSHYASQLALAFASKGSLVLLIDASPKAELTKMLGITPDG